MIIVPSKMIIINSTLLKILKDNIITTNELFYGMCKYYNMTGMKITYITSYCKNKLHIFNLTKSNLIGMVLN